MIIPEDTWHITTCYRAFGGGADITCFNDLGTFYIAAKIRTQDLLRANIDVRTINAAEAYISETFHTLRQKWVCITYQTHPNI